MEAERVSGAIEECFLSLNEEDAKGEAANVVDGLFAIARALSFCGRTLGTNDASTNMGALEFHALAIETAADRITAGLSEVAEALRGLKS